MPTTVVVRKLGAALGSDVGEDRAERLGMAAHYAFGAAGGPAARALMAAGQAPLRAALLVATGMEIVVDQVANTTLA
jgi:hypothetical protein